MKTSDSKGQAYLYQVHPIQILFYGVHMHLQMIKSIISVLTILLSMSMCIGRKNGVDLPVFKNP